MLSLTKFSLSVRARRWRGTLSQLGMKIINEYKSWSVVAHSLQRWILFMAGRIWGFGEWNYAREACGKNRKPAHCWTDFFFWVRKRSAPNVHVVASICDIISSTSTLMSDLLFGVGSPVTVRTMTITILSQASSIKRYKNMYYVWYTWGTVTLPGIIRPFSKEKHGTYGEGRIDAESTVLVTCVL